MATLNSQNRNRKNSIRSRKFAAGNTSLALAAAMAVAAVVTLPKGAQATTDSWNGTSSDWNTASNWLSAVPTAADTAAFNNATQSSVTFSAAGTALDLNFDGSIGYTIGTTGSAFNLALSTGGYVQMLGADTASQIINEPLSLGGNYSFLNNSTTSAANFTIGGTVSGTGIDTLTLGGSNIGIQTISGVIGNGTGTVSLTVTGSTWNLSGANTYSGGTTVTGGTLNLLGSLNTSGNLTVDGGTFTLAGITQDIGALAGTGGTVNLSSVATILAVNNGGNFAGQITDVGGLTVNGGTLILSGSTNNYSGGTTINGGTLEFTGSTANLTTGGITDDSSLVFAQSTSSSLSLAISGTGSVTENGSNGTTLTLSGANSYNGTTTISSGALEFTGDTSGLGGAVQNNSGLIFAQGSSSSLSGAISGPGNITEDGGGATTLTLSGNSTSSGTIIITAGALEFTGATAGLTGSIQDNAALIFGQSLNSGFSGSISGTGTLTQAGTAALTLSGLNTYTGGTTINSGATLNVTGSIMNAVADAGTFDVNNSFAITSLTGAGTTTLGSGDVLTINPTGAESFTGTINGLGGLTVGGTAALTLSGANTYTGGTTVASGTLDVTGGLAALGNLTVNGGIFEINNGTGQTLAALNGASVGTINLTSGGLTVNNGGSFAGAINGGGGLTLGGGTLTLSGANGYTGGTIVTGGTLNLTGTLNTTGNLTVNGGTFEINNGAGQTIAALNGTSFGTINLAASTVNLTVNNGGNFAGAINGGGNLTVGGTLALTLSGANTYSGLTTINSGSMLTVTGSIVGAVVDDTLGIFNVNNNFGITNLTGGGIVDIFGGHTLTVAPTSGADTFGGVIIDTGTLTVSGGAGTSLTLSGANTYTGGTTINSGATLNVTGSIIEAVADAGTININNTFGITNLTGTGTVAIANGKALTVAPTSNTDTFNGSIQGAGALTVAGGAANSLTLLAANTYSGGTTIGSGGAGATLVIGIGGSLESGSNLSFDTSGTDTFELNSGLTQNIGTLNGGNNAGAIIDIVTGSTLIVGDGVNFVGAIDGGGGLVVNSGTLAPNGSSTFSGGTTLENGSVTIVGSNTALGTGQVSIGTGGGTIQFGGVGGWTVANAMSISTTDTGTLDANGLSDTWSGIISGGGTLAVIDSNAAAGTIILTSAETYSGGTDIGSSGAGDVTLELSTGGSLNTSGNLTVGSLGTLQVNNGVGQEVVALNGGGNISLTAAADNLTVSNGGTFSGDINGLGGLTLDGGTLTLSGANGYTGGTTVNGGTLQITGSLASGNLSILNPGTFALDAAGGTAITTLSGNGLLDLTLGTLTVNGGGIFTGSIDGAGGLTVHAGTLSLLGTGGLSGYTGLTTIENGGTLDIKYAEILPGTDAFTFSSGGTLNFIDPNSQTIGNVTVSGTDTLDAGGVGNVLTIGGTITSTSNTNLLILQNGTLVLGNTGNSGSFTNGTLQLGNGALPTIVQFNNTGELPTSTVPIDINTATFAYTGNSGVSVTNNLVVAGTGNILTDNGLTGGNAFTLTGDLSGTGTLELTDGTFVFAPGASNNTGFTGTLDLNNSGGAVTALIDSTAALTGGVIEFDGGTLEANAAALVIGNNFTVNSGGGVFNDNGKGASGTPTQLNGVITGAGEFTILGNSQANDFVTLGNAANAPGGFTFQTITFNAGASGDLGVNTLTFNNATMDLTTASTTVGNTINLIAGTTDLINGGGNTNTIGGSIISNSGVGAVLRLQNGTFDLTGTNNAGGDFTVGELNVGNGTGGLTGTIAHFTNEHNLPADTVAIALDAGTLQYAGNGITVLNNVIAKSAGGALDINNTTGSTYAGQLQGTGSLTLENSSAAGGTLTLTGNNSGLSGGTTIDSGLTVNFQNTVSSTSNFGTGQIVLAIANDVLQYGANGINLGNAVAVNAASLLDINNKTGSIYSGSLSGSGALTLENSAATGGTLTFTGNNSSFTGTTAVNSGLTVNFQNTASSTSNFGSNTITLNAANDHLQYGAANITVGNALALASTGGTIDMDGQSGAWSGVISGAEALTVDNSSATAGELILTNADTYLAGTGASTIIDDGASAGQITLALENGGSLNSAGNIAIGKEGKLLLAHTTTFTQVIGSINSGSAASNITLDALNTLQVNAGGSFAGSLNGGGGLTVDGTASDTLALTGNLSGYTGLTTIQNQGTLDIHTASGVTAGNDLAFTFIAGTGTGGTLDLGPSQTIGVLTLSSSGAGADVLDAGGAAAITPVTLSGQITSIGTGTNALTLQDGHFAITNFNNAANFLAGTLQIGNGASATVAQFLGSPDGLQNALPGTNVVITLDDGACQFGGPAINVGNAMTVTGNNGIIDTNGQTGAKVSGVITITGALTLENTALGGGGALTLTGADTGAGGVTIDNGLTVNFTQNSAFGTGGVTLAAAGDTLQFGANGINLGSAIAVNANSNMDIDGTSGSQVSGIISGSSNLTLENSNTSTGNNTLILSGANTYGGNTTINNGLTANFTNATSFGSGLIILNAAGDTLQFGANNVILGNAIAVNANSNIDIDGNTGSNVHGALSGSSSLTLENTLATGGALALTGNNSGFTGNTTVDSGLTVSFTQSSAFGTGGTVTLAAPNDTLQFGGSFTVANNLDLASTGGAIDIQGNNSTWSGVISGNDLTAENTGAAATLTLTGINTYTGATTIDANTTLALAGNGGIADSSGVNLAGSSAVFSISGITSTGTSITSLSGVNNSTVTLGGKTLTITNGNATAGNNFAGGIGGAGGLTIAGGTEILSGANTYTGSTNISGNATLDLSGIGGIADSSSVNLNGGGAAFDISATTSGAGIISLSGVTSSNVNLGGETLTITNAGGIFNGAINGINGSVDVSGGTETLAGANTYTGTTEVSGGTVNLTGSLADNSALLVNSGTFKLNNGIGQTVVTFNGNGTVNLVAATDNLTVSLGGSFGGVITGLGGLNLTGGTETLSGINTYTGNTTVDSGATLDVNGFLTGIGNVVANGDVTFNNGLTTIIDTLTGTGTLDLAGIATTLDVTGTTSGTGAGTTSIFAGALLGNGILEASDSTLELLGNLTGFTGSLVATASGNIDVLTTGQLNSSTILDITNDHSISLAYGNLNGNALTFSQNATNGFLYVTGNNQTGTLNAITLATPISGITANTIDGGGISNTLTLAGNITGTYSGNLLILQDGTFVLGGTGTNAAFTGGTLQVGNGTLASTVQFSAAGSLPGVGVGITLNLGELAYTGSAGYTVANNITDTANTNNIIDAGGLSGLNSLNLNGSIANSTGSVLTLQHGNFMLSGTNNGAGEFTAGTLQIGNATTLGSPAAPAAAVEFTTAANLPGAGAGIWLNDGELLFNGNTIAGASVTIANNITLSNAASSINVIDAGNTVFGGTADAVTLSGNLINSVSSNTLQLQDGNFVLSGTNNGAGAFAAGTLELGNGGADTTTVAAFGATANFISGGANLLFNGATLNYTGGASATIASLITVGDAPTTNIMDAGTGTLNLTNTLVDTDGSTLILQNGTFNLSGTATNTSYTTGFLQVGGGAGLAATANFATAAAMPDGTGSAIVALNDGTLQYGANNINLASNVSLTASTTDVIDINNKTGSIYSGSLSGSGALTLENSVATGGTLTFTGNNSSFTGTTAVNSGLTVNFQNTASSTSNFGSNTITLNAANDHLQYGAANITVGNALALASTGGTIDMDGQSGAWSGVISGAEALTVDNSSATAGELILTNADTYLAGTGASTIIDDGASAGQITLALENGGSLNSAGNIAIGKEGKLLLAHTTTFTQVIGSINSGSAASNITLDALNTLQVNAGGSFAGSLNGGGGLTVDGTASDTLALTGNLSGYTGLTTIQNQGTLDIHTASGVTAGNDLAFTFIAGTGTGGTLDLGPSQTIGVLTLSSSGAGADVLDAGGAAAITPVTLSGQITSIGTGTNALTLQDGHFAITNFNNAANFLAGTLQIGNGASATVAQFLGSPDGLQNALPGTNVVITLDDGACQFGGPAINVGNAMTVTGNNGIIDTNGQTGAKVSGVITITGALTLENTALGGGGALTLTGADTGAGGVTIDNGLTVNFTQNSAFGTGGVTLAAAGDTLQFGANGINLGSAIAVNANSNMDIDGTSGSQVSGIISGSSNLTLENSNTSTGNNTLILSGANTYGGNTTINNGLTANFTNATSFGSGLIILNAAGDTLQFGANNVILGNAIAVNANSNIDIDGNTGSNVHGALSGSSSLTLENTLATGGALALTGNNSGFTGNTTVDSGLTVSFTQSSAFGTGGTVTLAAPNDTLQFGGSFTVANNLDLASTGGAIDIQGNNSTWSGVISGNDLTAENTGAAATLTLTGINTYTGATTIDANTTLALAGNGGIADSSGVNLAGSSAVFSISGITSTGTSITSLSGVNNSTVTLGGKTLTITNGNATAGNNFAGGIGGAGGLTIAGGTEILSGANTYTGSTTVNSGAALDVTGTLTGIGNVVDNGSLTFDNGTTTVIDTLSGGGILDLENTNATTTLEVTGTTTGTGPGVNSIFAGILEGNGTLEASDSTLTLTGLNSVTNFTGDLTAANGGNIVVTANAGQLNTSTALNITTNLSITTNYGNLNGNAVNFTGNTTDGYLYVIGTNATGTLGSAANAIAITDSTGTTINTIDAGGSTNTLILAGALTGDNTGVNGDNTLVLQNGTFVLTNTNTVTDFIGNGVLQIGDGADATIAKFSAAGNLPGSTVGITLDLAELTYTGGTSVIVSNNITDIAGTNNIIDAGTQKLTLNGLIANTTGTLTLQNGTLVLGGANNVSFSGGSLALGNGGSDTSTIADFALAANLPGSGANILLNGASLVYTGAPTNVTVLNAITIGDAPTTNIIDAGGAIETLSGQLTDIDGSTLILQDGTVVLGNTGNSASFTTGTLQIGNTGIATSIAQFAVAGDLPAAAVGISFDNGELQYQGAAATAVTVSNNLSLIANGIVDGGNNTGLVTLAGELVNTNAANMLTLQNGTFTLTNIGDSANNNTTFTAGTLAIGNGSGTTSSAVVQYSQASSLPGINAAILLNDGTLSYTGTGSSAVVNAIDLTGTGNGVVDAGTQTLTLSGAITDNSNTLTLQNGHLILSNASNSTDFVGGNLQIGHATLNGTVADTIVSAASASDLPSGTVGDVVGITLDSGTFQQTAGYTVANTISLAKNALAAGTNLDTLDVDGNIGTYTGIISDSGTGTLATLDLTSSVAGSGTVILNGTNTYAGATNILNGVVAVAGNDVAGISNAFGAGAATDVLTVSGTGSTLDSINAYNLTQHTLLATATGETIQLGAYTQDAGTNLNLVAFGRPVAGPLFGNNDVLNANAGIVNIAGTLNMAFSSVSDAAFTHPADFDTYTVITTTSTTNTGVTASGGASPTAVGATPVETAAGIGGNTYGTGWLSINPGSTNANYNPDLNYYENSPAGNSGNQIIAIQTLFLPDAQTPNEKAVAAYIDQNVTPFTVPQSSPLRTALANLSLLTPAQIGPVLNSLTPQAYSGLADEAFLNSTFLNQQVFQQTQNAFQSDGFNTSGLTMLDTKDQNPFAISMESQMKSAQQQAANSINYLDDNTATTSDSGYAHGSGFTGFVLGTVTFDHQANNGTYSQHDTTGGVLAGLDYRMNRHWVIGGLFNWNYTGGTVDNINGGQQISSYTPGLFAGYRQHNFYVDALVTYTYNSYRIDRNISIPGAASVATGKPDSDQYDAGILAGYNMIAAHGLKIGPAVGVGFTQLNISGFNETGSPFDLSVSKQHADSLRTLLGAQGQYTMKMRNLPLPINLNFDAFWQHECLNSARGITSSFSQISGGQFMYGTPGPSRDSALLGFGASGYLAKGVSLFVNYQTQIGERSQFAQTVMAGVAVKF